jgi:tRNA/tmRNA/rRNA uracil-C5-methylase (TrmA/RlmC/RlmD family)
MNYNSGNNLINQIDILALAGVVLAIWGLSLNYKNMEENEQQTEDLKKHLENQDNDYLKISIDQNNKIIQQNEEILKKL